MARPHDLTIAALDRITAATAIGLLLCVLAMLQTGCRRDLTRPDPPPRVIHVPVETYVEIDRQYTRRCQWVTEGAIEDIFDVARGRKRCLEIYEAALDTIEKIQGKPKP